MDIKKIILEEINDFDWIKDIDPNVTIDYDAVQRGLLLITYWVGQAYQPDDEVGIEIGELESEVTQPNIESVIEVLEHWHPYVDGDDVDNGLDFLKSALPPTSKYYVDFSEHIKEEVDDFDWIENVSDQFLEPGTDTKWVIINDIKDEDRNMHSVQEFLFNLGWKWQGDDSQEIYNPSAGGSIDYLLSTSWSNSMNLGVEDVGYVSIAFGSGYPNAGTRTGAQIYKASELLNNTITESEDFDWIRDTIPSEVHVGAKYDTQWGELTVVGVSDTHVTVKWPNIGEQIKNKEAFNRWVKDDIYQKKA